MAGEPIVVVACYANLPDGPPGAQQMQALRQRIHDLSGRWVTVRSQPINGCEGVLSALEIANRWKDWGLVVVDPSWTGSSCSPRPDLAPLAYFRTRPKNEAGQFQTKAMQPLTLVPITDSKTWIDQAAAAFKVTLDASVAPNVLLAAVGAVHRRLRRSRHHAGRGLVRVGNAVSRVGFFLLQQDGPPPPQEWGP